MLQNSTQKISIRLTIVRVVNARPENVKRLTVAKLNFMRNEKESHAIYWRSKQLTRTRLLDQESNAWRVTLIGVNYSDGDVCL